MREILRYCEVVCEAFSIQRYKSYTTWYHRKYVHEYNYSCYMYARGRAGRQVPQKRKRLCEMFC